MAGGPCYLKEAVKRIDFMAAKRIPDSPQQQHGVTISTFSNEQRHVVLDGALLGTTKASHCCGLRAEGERQIYRQV